MIGCLGIGLLVLGSLTFVGAVANESQMAATVAALFTLGGGALCHLAAKRSKARRAAKERERA
jgi:hypothetical protein